MDHDMEVHASFKSPFTEKEYRPGLHKNVDYDTVVYAKKQSFGKSLGQSVVLTPKAPNKKPPVHGYSPFGALGVNVGDLPQISDGAKRLIVKHKITDEQLLTIKATGKTGDLLTKDIRKYLKG